SDFISLVEKLKQYDKQIFIVGGRAFTSVVMQRNCHEFIAYENLTGGRRGDRGRPSGGPVPASSTVEQVMPLVRRALKVLSDREVSPQLGLLKSTLLQLDSTFSERTYGVSSFRDFAQKLATAGYVTLRENGRNVLVELKEDGHASHAVHHDTAPSRPHVPHHEPSAAAEPRLADGIREVRRLFQAAPNPPRWPMYVRQVKQFLRGVDPTFDERRYGFASLNDLLRACQREGLFRMERDRQGVMRFFQGNVMKPVEGEPIEAPEAETTIDVVTAAPDPAAAGPAEPDVVDGAVLHEVEAPAVIDVEESAAGTGASVPSEESRGRRRRAPKAASAQKPPKERKPSRPRAPRKKAAAPAGL
ncbi:MAG TPA: NYN domain-containing protein, partial [Vicinamibacterales bacterium]